MKRIAIPDPHPEPDPTAQPMMNRLYCQNGCHPERDEGAELHVWAADDLRTWWVTCNLCGWEVQLELPRTVALRG